MPKSSSMLTPLLTELTRSARMLGFTDTEWARRARVRKETLSRLRSRQTCDFETLSALARAVGATLGASGGRAPDSTPDGHFPACVDRDYEELLVNLCVSGDHEPAAWARGGPRFFMAGLAVMLASSQVRNRRALLALAEDLHPGASEVAVFNRWLERSPVRPSRFLPLVDSRSLRAA